jgi:hypothetical protein
MHSQEICSNREVGMMRRGAVITVVGFAVLAAQHSVPAEAQQATFQSPSKFGVSGTSSDATGLLVLEDVGRFPPGPEDGNLDVITADQDVGGRLSVLFGNGNGRFSAGPTTNLGRIPMGLAVALLNGDAVKDLLVTDTASQLVCYQGAAGGGPYQLAGGPFSVMRNPLGIEIADMNGDGDLDAVVVSEGDQAAGGVTILLGNGDCTFSIPVPPADSQVMAGFASSAVAVGDFNMDSRLDLAVANALSNDVTVLRRDAQGRYSMTQTLAVGDEPVAIEAVDLDNDTRLDLVVTNRNSDSVAVLRGRADGNFNAAAFYESGSAGSSPTGLAIGDLNLDGSADVVVPNNRSSDASILLGDGLGGLLPPRVFVADQEPLASAVGLVNADAAPDVIVINRGNQGPNAAVLLGLADGTVAAVEDLVTRSSPNSLAVGDFDNDGRSDVIVPHTDGNVLLFHRTADDGFLRQPRIDVGNEVNEAVPGDYDGNGLLDFVTINRNVASVTLFSARPEGGFEAGEVFSVGGAASSGLSVDLNQDGRSDVVVVRSTPGSNDAVDVLLADDQGGFETPMSYTVGQTTVEADFGDCNNDGLVDLFVANNLSSDVSILRGVGGGVFMAGTPRLVDGAPKSIAVADFDRDGRDDFAVAFSMSSSVVLYYGNGPCTFATGQQALSGGGSPSGLAARDFSGDGIPDLLVTDEVSNSVVLFTKVPGGQFFQRLPGDEVPVSRRPTTARGADFDGDGRYDGAASNSFVAGSVSILTNILAPQVLRGDANGDGEVTAADLATAMLEIGDGDDPRVEEAPQGDFEGGQEIDANGDGLITLQDSIAVAAWIFGG